MMEIMYQIENSSSDDYLITAKILFKSFQHMIRNESVFGKRCSFHQDYTTLPDEGNVVLFVEK